jgi:hypothetical protein
MIPQQYIYKQSDSHSFRACAYSREANMLILTPLPLATDELTETTVEYCNFGVKNTVRLWTSKCYDLGRISGALHTLSIYGSTVLLLNLGQYLSSLILYKVGRTPWTEISPSQGRYLHIEQHKQNKHTQTFMPRVGFEPTIPAFKRAKTVHALNRGATVIGHPYTSFYKHISSKQMNVRSMVTRTRQIGVQRVLINSPDKDIDVKCCHRKFST